MIREGVPGNLADYTDPLPQALVLTAIVIGFAMTAVCIVVAMRSRADNDNDHLDGLEAPPQERNAPAGGDVGAPMGLPRGEDRP